MSYAESGVNIDAGNALIERIKPHVKATHRPEVIGQLGGFSGLFALNHQHLKEPILVAATDGVGTKLKLAIQCNQHQGIGDDLVAMSVNDLIVGGAEPLFFLDYFATGQLNVNQAEAVIASIARACKLAGVALLGGETAEMPGMYQPDDYDLAGFCVGIVDKAAMITGESIAPGDRLIGIASSGPHANGYSLIRKILRDNQIDLATTLDGHSLEHHLLAPTKIYVNAIRAIKQQHAIKGMVHITGGGFIDNIPRVLPQHCRVQLALNHMPLPSIFQWLQKTGNIPLDDMLHTFNCGIGMVVIVSPEQANSTIATLADASERAVDIGEVKAARANFPRISYG